MSLRMVYTIATFFGMKLAKGDIEGPYTHYSPSRRGVYVLPSYELPNRRVFWLLLATMYGIVSASRKFQKASDDVFMGIVGLSLVLGVPQLFHKF